MFGCTFTNMCLMSIVGRATMSNALTQELGREKKIIVTTMFAKQPSYTQTQTAIRLI